MGYYQGDYYRGDYYQGFPLLAAALPILKKVGQKVLPRAGAAIGKVLGGRAGKILRGGTKVAAGGAAFELGSRVVRGRGGREMGGGGRRRMNVANVKALRRAIRRAHGFAKLSRKVLTFPISRPPKGRPLFKKTGRKR